jgi:hypothetical protein
MLIKYLKVKITAADISLAIKMAHGRTRKSFPQFWKQAADNEGDQAKEVKET